MKYATNRTFADPEKVARRLMEHAQAFEPVQDGRIYIENTAPFCLAIRLPQRIQRQPRVRDQARLAGIA